MSGFQNGVATRFKTAAIKLHLREYSRNSQNNTSMTVRFIKYKVGYRDNEDVSILFGTIGLQSAETSMLNDKNAKT